MVLDLDFVSWWALLHKSPLRKDSPFPLYYQPTRTISAVPRAEKRFISATRIWISAVWLSGCLAAMRSPKAFRQRIFASIIPAVKRGGWNTDLGQGASDRQMRLLHQANDLKLLCAKIPHAWSPPAPVMFFLSRRFSRLRSATSSFRAKASVRRSFTSPAFAWRAVSPASRFLPASRNSFDQL